MLRYLPARVAALPWRVILIIVGLGYSEQQCSTLQPTSRYDLGLSHISSSSPFS